MLFTFVNDLTALRISVKSVVVVAV